MVVHHGKECTVMTNDPTFEEQLANLKQYKLFGGKLALPGDIDPMSRFVRAASFLKTLPKAEDSNEAVAYLGGLVRSIMVPYGAEDTATSTGAPAVDVWPTRWVTIADLTNKRFYFLCTHSPNVFWIELDKLTSTAPDMLAVTPTNPDLNGDVSEQLIKFTSEQKEYPPPH
jgi:penicillin V acylase-like amidase (Ntn superfamily)